MLSELICHCITITCKRRQVWASKFLYGLHTHRKKQLKIEIPSNPFPDTITSLELSSWKTSNMQDGLTHKSASLDSFSIVSACIEEEKRNGIKNLVMGIMCFSQYIGSSQNFLFYTLLSCVYLHWWPTYRISDYRECSVCVWVGVSAPLSHSGFMRSLCFAGLILSFSLFLFFKPHSLTTVPNAFPLHYSDHWMDFISV